MFVQDAPLKLQAQRARLGYLPNDLVHRRQDKPEDQHARYGDIKVSCLPPLPDVSMSGSCSIGSSLDRADTLERCPRRPQAYLPSIDRLKCMRVQRPSISAMLRDETPSDRSGILMSIVHTPANACQGCNLCRAATNQEQPCRLYVLGLLAFGRYHLKAFFSLQVPLGLDADADQQQPYCERTSDVCRGHTPRQQAD